MKSMENVEELRRRLMDIERDFCNTREIENDPVSLILKFIDPGDREIVAFLTAVFSYGNVKQIQKSLETIFLFLGPHPAKTIQASTGSHWKRQIPRQFRHRFNGADDLGLLLTWLGEALRQSGSLKNFFYVGLRENKEMGEILEDFIQRLTSLPGEPFKKPKSKGALFFLPRPSGGSACKRLLLFLRWVSGVGPMDLNLWTDFPRELLLIPVDTHVLRISKHLGLTKRKDNSWRTAQEITEKLKLLDSKDPTRFDFALCHMGISKQCPSRVDRKICDQCGMNSLCVTYNRRRATSLR